MNVILMDGLHSLGSATAAVTALAIATWLLLRLCRLQSLTIQRFAWLLVLVPGAVGWRLPVELPILPSAPDTTVELTSGSVSEPQMIFTPNTDSPFRKPNGLSRLSYASDAVPDSACVLLLAAWLLGMIILAARWSWSYAMFLKALPRPLWPEHEWATELDRVSAELRLTRPFPLHVTEHLGPALCLTPAGYALLVPRMTWSRFSSQQRRAILRHELAHYLRNDLWKSLLVRLLAWPQWFNPLAWLAVRNFDDAAECACDDVAVRVGEEVAFDYLRALLDLVTTEGSASALQAGVHGGALQSRVRRLLSRSGKDSVMKKLVVVVVAISLAAGGVMRIQVVSAQSPLPSKIVAALDPGSSDPMPQGERLAVEPVDGLRPASATATKPIQEAFIDLQRAFKEVHAIHGRLMELNEGIRAFDVEVKAEQLRLQSLAETRKTTGDPAQHLRIDTELTDGQRKLQERANQLREQCLKDEAKIYHDGFEQIRKATAEYARQHGIRVVRRSQSSAYAEEKAADEQLDVTDRKAVLARVNRPVIFFDGPSETPTDITDAIVERLNRVQDR